MIQILSHLDDDKVDQLLQHLTLIIPWNFCINVSILHHLVNDYHSLESYLWLRSFAVFVNPFHKGWLIRLTEDIVSHLEAGMVKSHGIWDPCYQLPIWWLEPIIDGLAKSNHICCLVCCVLLHDKESTLCIPFFLYYDAHFVNEQLEVLYVLENNIHWCLLILK